MSEKSTESPSRPNAEAAESRPAPADQVVQTEHTVTIDGREIAYTVTTGTLVLREESEKSGEHAGESEGEKARATIFFVAYTRRDAGDAAARSITFSFNGGPGSSSVWLHLGVLGPRRVWMDDTGNLPPPPYRLEDNAYSLLDHTDLVFIDPVSTGYSRSVVGEKAKRFHDFQKDIESVGDFIRLYTTRWQRWLSPKFLIGESYGTTRAGGLAGYLQDRHGMYLNGILLVSVVLDFQTLEFLPTNDLPYVVYLPTYTATAWYHRRLDASLQKDLGEALDEARAFALGEYASALLRGASLPAKERAAVAKKLARFTGLPLDFVERCDLRVNGGRFCKELLREQRRTVGRLDSRFTGIDRDSAGDVAAEDPSFTNIMGPYTAAFYDYVRGELKFESDLPYEVINLKANEAWTFGRDNRFVEVSETLRRAMTINPHLKVFVANGYFDLATPFLATEYTFDHLGLDPELRGNVTMAWYEAGHMMYIHRPSLEALRRDLVAFLGSATGAPAAAAQPPKR